MEFYRVNTRRSGMVPSACLCGRECNFSPWKTGVQPEKLYRCKLQGGGSFEKRLRCSWNITCCASIRAQLAQILLP